MSAMSEDSEEFWAAVRRLPARQAQAAALRFVYDMPIADIAAALDCTSGHRQAAPQPCAPGPGSPALALEPEEES